MNSIELIAARVNIRRRHKDSMPLQ